MNPNNLEVRNNLRGGDLARINESDIKGLILAMLDYTGVDEPLILTISSKAHVVRGQNLHGKVSIGKPSKTGQNFQVYCQTGSNGSQIHGSIQKKGPGKIRALRNHIVQALGGKPLFDSKTMAVEKVAIRGVPPVPSVTSTHESSVNEDQNELGKPDIEKPLVPEKEPSEPKAERLKKPKAERKPMKPGLGKGFLKKPENLAWMLDLIKRKTQKRGGKFSCADLHRWIVEETGKDIDSSPIAQYLRSLVFNEYIEVYKGRFPRRPKVYIFKQEAPEIPVSSKAESDGQTAAPVFTRPQQSISVGHSSLESFAAIRELVHMIDYAFHRIGEESKKVPELEGSFPHEVYVRIKEDPRFN